MTETKGDYTTAADNERKPWRCTTPGCGTVLGYMTRESFCGRMLMVCYVTINDYHSKFVGTGLQMCPECLQWIEWHYSGGYRIGEMVK